MEKVQIPRRKPTVENKADKKVRGRPFQAGNPGRPLGSKNRTTRLVEQLLDGEAEAITRKFLELALAGNPKCLQLCLDRLLPRRSGRPLELELPPANNIHGVTAAMAAISAAINDGRISAEEADHLVNFFSSFARILEAHDFMARLDAVESRLSEIGK